MASQVGKQAKNTESMAVKTTMDCMGGGAWVTYSLSLTILFVVAVMLDSTPVLLKDCAAQNLEMLCDTPMEGRPTSFPCALTHEHIFRPFVCIMNIIRKDPVTWLYTTSTWYTLSCLLEEYSSTGELLYRTGVHSSCPPDCTAPTCTGKRQYSTHPLMHRIQCIPPSFTEIKNRQRLLGYGC